MRKIALVLSLAACAAAVQEEVPMSWSSTGHIMIPALVNKKGPYLFMLDTGADVSGVYTWFAAAHALPEGKSSKLDGATGAETEITTKLASLSVDGRTIREVQADTYPDRADGAKLAGIVGVDLMGDYLSVLDLGCKTAALLPIDTDPAKVAGTGAQFLSAGGVKDGKQLTFPATINGVPGVAILDTGAKSTMVNSAFAKAAHVDIASAAFSDGAPARGATLTAITSRTGPIGTVRFAGIVRTDFTARVVDLPAFKGMGLADRPTVNVGLDLLRGVRLTVDYSRHSIGFAHSSCST